MQPLMRRPKSALHWEFAFVCFPGILLLPHPKGCQAFAARLRQLRQSHWQSCLAPQLLALDTLPSKLRTARRQLLGGPTHRLLSAPD